MKKKFVACLLAGLMLLGAAALADGGEWHESRIGGSVRLTGYTGDYNGTFRRTASAAWPARTTDM